MHYRTPSVRFVVSLAIIIAIVTITATAADGSDGSIFSSFLEIVGYESSHTNVRGTQEPIRGTSGKLISSLNNSINQAEPARTAVFFAGLTGTKNIPGDYADLSAAIADLNANGVGAGGVTFNVIAANPQTAPVGGYLIGGTGSLVLTTSSSSNPIIFTGNGNVVTASSGQTAGSLVDAVFKLVGVDWVTIQGFTMQESATNTITTSGTNNMTEFGVALFYVSTTDGAQNNIIQNNTISLNRTYQNSFGIYSNTRHTSTVATTTADITNASGSNSFNKVYGNAISNVNYGTVFIGSGALTAVGAQDNGTDIGGASAATGNTYTNWGGIGLAPSGYVSLTGNNYCIFVNNTYNDNISFNTITSATGASSILMGGILKNYSTGSTAQPTGTITTTINNNNVTVTNNPSSASTGGIIGINNQGLSPLLSTATMSINNNTVQNSVIGGSTSTSNGLTAITNLSLPGTMNITGNNVLNNSITATTQTSGSFTGISNTGAAGTLNITNNVIRGTSSTGTSAGCLGISNSGAATTAINITGNQLGNSSGGFITFPAATSGVCNGIQNSAGASTSTLSISNNSFQGFSFVTAGSVTAILNTSGFVGGSITMNGNSVGTSSGGFATYSGANSAGINGVINQGGSSTSALSMQTNDVRGIVHSVAASSAHTYISNSFATLSQNISSNTFTNLNVNTTGSVTFISNNVALPSTGSVTANSNSIVTAFNKGGAGGTVTLYLTTTTPSSVALTTKSEQNNNFSNITLTGATSMAGWMDVEGATGGGSVKTIKNNTFSNWTMGTGAVAVIQTNYGNSNSSVSNNTISNISTTAVSGGSITGITIGSSNGGSTQTVSSNSITGLSAGSLGLVTGITGGSSSISQLGIDSNTLNTFSSSNSSGSVVGLAITAGASVNIAGNTINTLSGNGSSTAVATGISVSNGTTVTISKNKIYDLLESASTSTPAVNGMLLSGGTTVTATNNLIGDLRATGVSSTDAIRGFNITSSTASTTFNIYYNTVNIAATSSGANFGTTGIFHTISTTSTTAALNLRNNNIVNTSTPAGTGLTVAYRRSAGAASNLANYASTSNNNNFYAGTPGVSNLIYSDGTGSAQTLSAYKGGVFTAGTIAPRDSASFSENPSFLSTTGSSSQFLHVNTTIASQLESGAATISGITDDFDGDTRNVSTPDVGADEFTGIPIDLTAPNISYSALAGTASTTARTLTATITDATGVPTTGTGLPVLYWKLNAGSYTAATATSLGSNQYQFSFGSGVTSGDIISYYIVAQDTVSPTPNVGASPSVGASGFTSNPPAVSTAPTSPSTYTILPSISGTKSVGTGAGCPGGAGTCDYGTLTAAITALNAAVVTGPVTLTLTDSSYSAGETFPLSINANGGSSATNTVTIKPAVGVTPTISGAVASSCLIKINAASYVTIDGSNAVGGTTRDLTITNTSTTSPAAVCLISGGTGLGATNNTVKNTNISTGVSAATGYGIAIGGSTPGTSGADNDNDTIQNNNITVATISIYANGTAAVSAGGDDNLNITGNTVNSSSTIQNYGIEVGNALSSAVSGNIVSVTSSGTAQPTGISLETGFVSSSVSGNKITNALATNTGGYGGRGITVGTGTATSSLTIANNVIYGVNGSNWNSFANSSSMGIAIGVIGGSTTVTTTAGGINLYYNSVSMNGSMGSGSTSALTTAIYIGTGATTLDLRNNIFANTQVGTSTTQKNYAIFSAATNASYFSINYNDYFVSNTFNAGSAIFGNIGSTDRATLSALQTAFGGNTNSTIANPQFNSATNLQLQLGSPVLAAGTPIAGITTDFTGATRSATTPAIGAYENGVDTAGPTITYTNLTNTSSTSDRTLTATLIDPSGVATAGLAPRVYYKKGAGSYFSQACSLMSGTVNNGNWDCAIINADMGGVTASDVISYFVIAQDTLGNILSNPATGLVATNVNTVTTPPTTPNTYTIVTTYSGSLNVGSAETITSLTNTGGLFEKINNGTVSGNVTVNLTSDLTAETGTVSLNQTTEEGAGNWTLTIKPSASPRVVSGSSATCLINLNGADRVTIDGAVSGTTKDMTLSNTNTSGATVCFANAATNNTVKNSIVKGVSTLTTNGVVFFSTVATGTTGNSNNTIQNNDLRGGATAAGYVVYNTGTITAKNTNNLFTQNRIFDFSVNGIRDDGNSANATYSQNEIFEQTTQTAAIVGFRPSATTIDGFTFTRNYIHDLNTTSTGSVYGIHLFDTSTVATSEVSNNMITLSSTAPLTLRGIYDQTATGEKYNVYYNSVYLGGVVTGASNSEAYYWSVASTTNAKGNVFVNARNGGTGKHYAYRLNSTLANIVSDFNDIYSTGGTGNVFGNDGTVDRTSLADWRTGTSKDTDSISADPLFTSTTDLHITSGSPARDTGVTIAGVTNDFDGDLRPTLYDIGADEYLDVAAPDTTITGATPPNPSNVNTATFTFSGSDTVAAPSLVASFECDIDGGGFSACTSPKSTGILTDGSHTFSVRSKDGAGNVDPTPATFTWVIDTVRPDTAILTSPADPTNSTSASFTFDGSDVGGSGVSSFACSLDNAPFATCSSPANYTALAAGPHNFRVQATDAAGNTDLSAAQFNWTIDLTAPETNLLTQPTNPSNSTSPSFTFDASDPGSTFECDLDGGGFAACTSPKGYTGLADGSHTFQVRATDAVGNTDATPATFTWVIDTELPVIAAYTPLGNAAASTAQVFTVTVTDNVAVNSVSVYFAVNGGPYANAACAFNSGSPQNGTYDCTVPGQLTGSAVSYYVTATDTAGNAAERPSAAAPNLFMVGIAAVPAGTYSNISATDGSSIGGDVTVTGNLALGGVLATGANTLTIDCSATVTGAGATNYVDGIVKKNFCSLGAFSYPVGQNGYSPVDVTITTLATNPSSLTITPIDGVLSPLAPEQSLSRTWDLTETGDLTATLLFHYIDGDVDQQETDYRIWRKEGSNAPVNMCPSAPCVDTVNNTIGPITGVSQFSKWTGAAGGALAPTAAGATLAGRVLTSDGRGIRNAVVTVSGNILGAPRRVLTGAFGYYQFDELEVGETYVVTVETKQFTFTTPARVVSLTDNILDLDFTALPRP